MGVGSHRWCVFALGLATGLYPHNLASPLTGATLPKTLPLPHYVDFAGRFAVDIACRAVLQRICPRDNPVICVAPNLTTFVGDRFQVHLNPLTKEPGSLEPGSLREPQHKTVVSPERGRFDQC